MRVQPQNVGRSTTRNRPHASCYIKSLKNTPHSMSTLYQATSYQSPKTTPHSISTLYQATSYQSPKTTPHSISTLYQATSYQSPKTTPHSLCPYQVAPSMINSHFSGETPSNTVTAHKTNTDKWEPFNLNIQFSSTSLCLLIPLRIILCQ